MPGHNKGFTLIELMVTIAIAAILVTAGVPAFNRFVESNREAAQVNQVIRALSIARSEAVTRNVTVTVCPGTATSSGTATCSTDWSKGWIVFVDDDEGVTGNGAFDSGDTLLNVFAALDGGNKFKSSLNTISYDASGLGSTKGTLTLCDRNGEYLQGILISATGAARTSDKDDSGNTLTCA
ncbi:MAG TPA: GspH/FimT family pseudopilin [Gammaproteobacteria bacterium]|jgi:type IV fimbrial biogenesis protein FimT|nr:GspH/FimT family pseudopilin [Gammaproteobacteria bacterium]